MTEDEPIPTPETKASEITGGLKLRVVDLADFKAVDCDAPIADIRKVECECFASSYRKAAEASKADGDESASRVFALLADVTRIHFKPDDQGEPYGPLFVIDSRRSIIPDDLRGEQSTVFAAVAATIKNPGLRARVADIAWLNDRSQGVLAQLAIESFTEAVRLVADGRRSSTLRRRRFLVPAQSFCVGPARLHTRQDGNSRKQTA